MVNGVNMGYTETLTAWRDSTQFIPVSYKSSTGVFEALGGGAVPSTGANKDRKHFRGVMSTADGLFWRQEVVRAALTIPTIFSECSLEVRHKAGGLD